MERREYNVEMQDNIERMTKWMCEGLDDDFCGRGVRIEERDFKMYVLTSCRTSSSSQQAPSVILEHFEDSLPPSLLPPSLHRLEICVRRRSPRGPLLPSSADSGSSHSQTFAVTKLELTSPGMVRRCGHHPQSDSPRMMKDGRENDAKDAIGGRRWMRRSSPRRRR